LLAADESNLELLIDAGPSIDADWLTAILGVRQADLESLMSAGSSCPRADD